MNIKRIAEKIALSIFIISSIMIFNHFFNSPNVPNRNSLNSNNQVTNNKFATNKKEVLLEYSNLYKENKDMIGWISIDDTRIDYPVMQSMSDNEKYLHKDWNEDYNYAGLPFLDNRCSIDNDSNNLLIYGHNMINNTMFSDLLKYKDKSFYELHPKIEFDTIFENRMYEIVGVFRSEVYNESDDLFKYYYFFGYNTENEFNEYKKEINNKKLYDTGKSINYGDKLLTLSTCDVLGNDSRFVVVAKMIN